MESRRSKESQAQAVPGETQDRERAARFWERNSTPGKREEIERTIAGALEPHDIGIFMSGDAEEDAEKIAAYRLLAREMGYAMGQFILRPDGRFASARIRGRLKK